MKINKKSPHGVRATLLLLGLITAFSVLPTTLAVAAPDIAGVKIADSVEVAGSKLVLNGAGIRYRAVFKVYTAALYVGKKVSTPDEFYAAPGPKRFILTLLRDIDSNDFGKSFTQGFTQNASKAEMSKHIPG